MNTVIQTMTADGLKNETTINTYGSPISVAGRIKARRNLLTISTREVAKRLGISTPEYCMLEKRYEPKDQALHLFPLASILRTTREWLERGDPDRLILTPNTGNFIHCDQFGIPRIDTSPYTKEELAQLPFCKEYKDILKNYVKSVGMPFSEYFWYGDEFFLIYPGMSEEVLADLREHTGYPGWENMKVADQCAMFNLPLLQSTASELAGKPFVKKPYGKSQGLTIEQFVLDV